MMRIYRALLVLLPPAFRARYRQDLLDAFDHERRDPRHAGLRGAVRFWTRILADLMASATRQRASRAAAVIHTLAGTGTPTLPPPPKRTTMDTLLQDVRYALRNFVRRPGFTAVSVLSLAIGIGGNTVIYGIVDGLVLHPFSYPDSDRLMAVGVTFPKLSSETRFVEVLSPAEYADIKESRAFSTTTAFDLGNRNISGGDVPERVFTALLLDDPFPVLGLKPILGRGFTPEELAPAPSMSSAPPIRVAIISHRLWQSRFGGDPDILSRGVRISSNSVSIVGVMPPGLLLIGTDLWIPWGGDATLMPRNIRQFTVMGRLGPGVSAQQANAELAVIAARTDQASRAQFKEYEGWRLTATPWAAALMQDVRPAALMLLGAVAFVLLIACANITNLFLARSTTRQRELAVRLALGAERWRIARHLLTESLLLATAGAAAGLLLAWLGIRSAGALVPAQLAMLGLAPLGAQAQKQPRTPWGDPDLTGAYSEFTTAPLERAPEYGDREFLERSEYEEFAKRRLEQRFDADDTEPGTQEDVHYSMGQFQLSENEGVHSLNLRTSIVTQPKNGRIPPLTAEAAARRDARAAARRGKEFDGPEMRSLTERCIIWSSTQPPILPRGYNSNLQIFQSPGYVIVQGEMGDPRVIPTDGRKLPDKLLPQWNGTSVGHWEGETFVIETAGFHPDSAWRNASENMRVTERITRIDEDTLEYAFTVVDPSTWAEPWGGVYPLTKLDGLLYEYACTEGNYGMANILSGARVAEKEAAAKQQ